MIEYYLFHFADFAFSTHLAEAVDPSETIRPGTFATFFQQKKKSVHTVYLKLLHSYLDAFLCQKHEINLELGLIMTQIFTDVWLQQISTSDNQVHFSSKFLKRPDSPLYCFSLLQQKMFSNERMTIFAKPLDLAHSHGYYSSERHVVPLTPEMQVTQSPLFQFLLYVFKYWPKNEFFPYQLIHRIWWTQILPPHIKEDIPVMKKQENYIISNWAFYNQVMTAFFIYMNDRNLFLTTNEEELEKATSVVTFLSKIKDKLISIYLRRNDFVNLVTEHKKNLEIEFNIVFSEKSDVIDYVENIIVFAGELESDKESFVAYTSKQKFDLHKYTSSILERITLLFREFIKDDNLRQKRMNQRKITNAFDEEELEPAFEKDGRLTKESKEQLRKGIVRSNPLKLSYLGDDLSRPRATYEIPYLTESLISISRKMNRQFQTRAINLRFLATWWSLVVLVILCWFFGFSYVVIKLTGI